MGECQVNLSTLKMTTGLEALVAASIEFLSLKYFRSITAQTGRMIFRGGCGQFAVGWVGSS